MDRIEQSSPAKNAILVVGSANIDLVVTAARFPRPGETVFGSKFGMFPGGKGANQAVCCAKLGARVNFLGKTGRDFFRDRLVWNMEREGVGLGHLLIDRQESTGIALITVGGSGQNEIIVIPGSNMKLSPADIEKRRKIFLSAGITLLQLEIPLETVKRAVSLAKKNGHLVILNPAPARKLPPSLLKLVDFLTPNETEAEILTGIHVGNLASAEKASLKLVSKGVKNVIVTLGEKGCLLARREGVKYFPALKVKAVDTTAAGDAFNGALAYSLSRNRDLNEAIRFANKVAAFSATRRGAQSSMPTLSEMKRFP